MSAAVSVAIIALMAWGRRAQGGFFPNLDSRWERLISAAIAGLGALLLTLNPVVAVCVALGWFGACHIGLFASIGRDDPVWRGAVRGFIQPLPSIALLIAAYLFDLAPLSPYLMIWSAIGAFEGVIYKLCWLVDDATRGKRWHVQATVFGEYVTGALRGAGMVVAL